MVPSRRWITTVVVSLLAAMLIAVGPGVATGADHADTLQTFSFADGELPEGVTVDRKGNVYYPFSPLGQVWKLRKGSGEPVLFAQLDGLQPGDFGILGMTVDRRGHVYAGVGSSNPDVNGVWKFHRRTGAATRVPGTEGAGLPNDVAFDLRGNLYISDSLFGLVWVVPRGGDIEVFVDSPLLDGTGGLIPGFPIGANGLEIRKRTMYVAVTEQASIVKIPIRHDGSAGTPTVWHQGPELGGIDGIAVARSGNVYAAVIGQSTVVRVNTDHSVDVIATVADGIDWGSSIAFGTNRHDEFVYVVNYGIGPNFGAPEITGPALLRIAVGEKGVKVPG